MEAVKKEDMKHLEEVKILDLRKPIEVSYSLIYDADANPKSELIEDVHAYVFEYACQCRSQRMS